MSASVIDVQDLRKTFGSTTALDGLDMQVHTGEVMAFLGPNGAGKSTTIRVLLGLLRADAGHVRVLGTDPWADPVTLHRRLVYVPGDVELWPNLTGGEAIDVLHRLRPGVDVSRRDELVDRFDLDLGKRCRAYSKGNRQKVALVAALACDVELYVLDEPTSGLDPLMETVFQDAVRELRDDGRSVLLSSHILSEAEDLGDSVTIVRDGRTVQSGRLDELEHLSRRRLTVTLTSAGPDVASLPGLHDASLEGRTLTSAIDEHHLDDVLRALADHGVEHLEVRPPSLEQLFLDQYRRQDT